MSATQEPIYTDDAVTLRATVRNHDRVLADPTAANGRVLHVASGDDFPIVFVQQSTGVWEAVFVPTLEGQHWWSINTTGVITKSGEKSFNVSTRRVPQS